MGTTPPHTHGAPPTCPAATTRTSTILRTPYTPSLLIPDLPSRTPNNHFRHPVFPRLHADTLPIHIPAKLQIIAFARIQPNLERLHRAGPRFTDMAPFPRTAGTTATHTGPAGVARLAASRFLRARRSGPIERLFRKTIATAASNVCGGGAAGNAGLVQLGSAAFIGVCVRGVLAQVAVASALGGFHNLFVAGRGVGG